MNGLLDTLLKNADLLLADGSVRRDAEVGIRGGVIVSIADKGQSGGAADAIDCGGNLLTPGFYNAHAHSPMTLLRGYGENLPLMRWLTERIFPAEDKLTADDVYYGTLLAGMEMARGGTVSASDMYFFTMAMGEAFSDAGMKVNLSPCLTCSDGRRFDELPVCAAMGELSARFAGHPLVHPELAIHAEYTTTEKSVRGAAEYAREHGLRLHLHLSETESEHNECIARHGRTPAQYFEDCGVFAPPVTAAHCVYCTPEDFALLARRGVTAVSCPSSNLKLASGIIDAASLTAAGVRLALGTDGAASNNGLSMLEAMKLFSLTAKYRSRDAAFITPGQVFDAATVGGARAQGRGDCGTIAVGNRADFALWDMSAAPMTPCFDPVTALVYAADPGLVKLTMVDGRVIYRDGEYKTIDSERVRFEIRERKPK